MSSKSTWQESLNEEKVIQSASEDLKITPLDSYNASLLDQVHPRAYDNPQPQTIYNMVAIGAGAGGLVTAAASTRKAALIEEELMGGDCLNTGCVPSKAVLACAKRIHQVQTCEFFGCSTSDVKVDFPAIMARMRKIRAHIAENDSQPRFTGLGVDVFLGRGRFTSPSTVEVDGKTLHFKKACVATGGHALLPDVPGLASVHPRTNATLFNLTALPARLAVMGAGPVGCEMAQAFARFGSKVTLLLRSERILKHEDAEAALVVQRALQADGVRVLTGVDYKQVSRDAEGCIVLDCVSKASGDAIQVCVDELLVAAGRAPRVQDLGLEAAGVEFDPQRGVKVNDSLQTSNPNIYAVGDVCLPGKHQLTHMAGQTADMVVNNALDDQDCKLSDLVVPSCVYTDPELAHTGASEAELKAQGVEYNVTHRTFDITDRNMCDGDLQGFVKFFTKKAPASGCVDNVDDLLLGAVVVGSNAGEFISTATLMIKQGVGCRALASTIVPYPTKFENFKYAGNRYNFTLDTDPQGRRERGEAKMALAREEAGE